MPGDEMNKLLELAVDRCTALADKVELAFETLDKALDGLLNLAEVLEDDGNAVHDEFEEAAHQMDATRGHVVTAVQDVGHALESLPARADEAEQETHQLLARLREDVSHLTQARENASAERHARLGNLDAELDGLAHEVQAFRDHLDQRFQPAEKGVEHLRDELHSAQVSAGNDHASVSHSIENLGQAVNAGRGAVHSSVVQLTAVIGRTVVDSCNELLSTYNLGSHRIRESLTDETPQAPHPSDTWVSQRLEPVRTALTELGALEEPAEDSLGTSAGAILDKGEQAVDELGRVADSLHAAASSAPH
jgi:uncharacterized protein YoxC